MNLFLDSSALVKTLLSEQHSSVALRLWNEAAHHYVSRLTYVETRAALARAHRLGRLSEEGHVQAKAMLRARLSRCEIVEVDAALVEAAGDLAQVHGLKGYDAVQLASALAVAVQDVLFAAWDRTLAEAGFAEGLTLATS
ncbi:MAG: type II toxin-antitoxin system VapC family toxin [Dehalococcoidia bacterium]